MNSLNMDKAPLPACTCCLTLCALIGLGITGWFLPSAAEKMGKSISWSNPDDWREADCKVLAVGVSCTEQEWGRNCDGFQYLHTAHLGSTLPKEGPVTFRYQDQAVCPGRYWCAYEGNDCECDGRVLFSVQVMVHGNYVAGDVVTEAEEVEAPHSGHLKCGQDAHGNALKDPSPYKVKSCWCTPKVIVDKLTQKKDKYRHPRVCAHKANDDFADEPIVTERRRLESVPDFLQPLADNSNNDNNYNSNSNSNDLDDDLDDDDEIGAGSSLAAASAEVEEERAEADDEEARELTIHHTSTSNSRRRRTYQYMPWALVEVPPAKGAEDQETVITCAYKYGTLDATIGEYHTDGAPSNNLFHVTWGNIDDQTGQTLANSWTMNGGHHTCKVRTNGVSAEDTCSVAMEPLHQMAEASEGGYWWLSKINLVCKICTFVFLLLTAVLAVPVFWRNTAYDAIA